ncbi:ribose-phosphate pyrophosphokinase [Polymorphobacter sp. PAMC 29334]|uniref:ribose-phosphate pyrophosphokinase n=1 Tax=Polymorphobacter sp. PAMC 29334 TaxID=2862331 RepID=UPI001D01AEDD|nr:ribose-phosphate pyrophosphokinase [Polymorphobacter sp. PAMC 29334]
MAGAAEALIDPDHVAALLHARARAGESVTYSEVLGALGYAFSRPKMRALCVVLMDVDAAERGAGRPDLAVLVVRQSDRLPGQGWWIGRSDYKGLFVGAEAAAYVAREQRGVFAWWREHPRAGPA